MDYNSQSLTGRVANCKFWPELEGLRSETEVSVAMLRCCSRRLGCLRVAHQFLAHTDNRNITFCIDRKARLCEGRVGLWWASVRARVSSHLLTLKLTPGSLDRNFILRLCGSGTPLPLPRPVLFHELPSITLDQLSGSSLCGPCDRRSVQSSCPSPALAHAL